MQARSFFRAVSNDRSNLIDRLLGLMHANGIRYCVIGGLAVSAYAEPLVGLELDLIVANYQLGRFESLLASAFLVRRSPRFIEITAPDSGVRVNVWTESRFAEFVDRAQPRTVLEIELPVAALEDVFAATVWNASDLSRSPVKRQRDLVDLARLLQAYPKYSSRVPPAVKGQLVSAGA